MEILAQLKERLFGLKEVWIKLSLNQKVLLSGALLLIITAIIMSSTALLSTKYEPLFANLNVNDAAALTAKLDELKIPYQLADEGTSIMVPSEFKYSARLQLATAGFPQGVVGFEIFNQTSFGETETDKRIKYQVALQGELTKTIQSLEKIEMAKVNLVMPQKSLYSEDQETATASVLIKNKLNTPLSPKEIQGIVHLVANSVEGLKSENVTVVDTNGNVLSSGMGGIQTGTRLVEMTQAQMALQRQYEKEMQLSVQSMLERLVGVDKAVVRVSAVLDFDERQSHREIYSPIQDKQTPATFVRSDKQTEESTSETGAAPQGAAGTDSNIPTYQETTQSGSSASSDRTERVTNWEIDKEEIQQKFAPGTLKKLTVAVLIDKDLSQKEKNDIQQLVENAVGIDANNPADAGFLVSVTSMNFTAMPEVRVPTSVAITNAFSHYGWLIVLILGLVGMVLLIRRSFPAAEEELGFDQIVDEEISIQDLLEKELSPEEKERKLIQEEVGKLIDSHPDDVANLIRTWLLEEGT